MTLSNDPFDFLYRSDGDASSDRAGREPSDPARAGRDGLNRERANGAVPGKPFQPDLDAFFDDEMSDDESELLYEHIRRERELAADMLGTQRALDALRTVPRCPDFSQQILQRVDRKRGLLSGPWLQRVFVGRVAIAAGLLLAMGGIFALHRASPGLATMGQPTPIGQLASAVPADARRSSGSTETSMESSSWAAGLNIQGAAMDSRAALHARSVMQAGPEARRAMVEAGETLPMGGDGVVFAEPATAGSVAHASDAPAAAMPTAAMMVRPTSQMAVEFPGLQGVAVVHDPAHERAFQAMLAAQPEPAVARDTGFDDAEIRAASRQDRPLASRQATNGRPAQPIVTDDCVYYMGRVIDRHAFQTVLLGFTAMAPLSLD